MGGLILFTWLCPGSGSSLSAASAATWQQQQQQRWCYTPACCLRAAGLVALRVLCDKRHILTQDSNGQVQLWDVLAGQPIQQLGQVRGVKVACLRNRAAWCVTPGWCGVVTMRVDFGPCCTTFERRCTLRGCVLQQGHAGLVLRAGCCGQLFCPCWVGGSRLATIRSA